jgi:hypothetical protein
MRRTCRYLAYSTVIIASISMLLWLASLAWGFAAPAKPKKLWGYRCAEVVFRPNPANPLDGCIRVGFDCRGGCAVGGVIPHFRCVFGGIQCTEVMRVRFVRVPSLPCMLMLGAGGAGCRCDHTVPPVNAGIFLHLPGC